MVLVSAAATYGLPALSVMKARHLLLLPAPWVSIPQAHGLPEFGDAPQTDAAADPEARSTHASQVMSPDGPNTGLAATLPYCEKAPANAVAVAIDGVVGGPVVLVGVPLKLMLRPLTDSVVEAPANGQTAIGLSTRIAARYSVDETTESIAPGVRSRE